MAENKKTKSNPVTEETTVETATDDQVIIAPEPTRDVPTLGFNEDGVMGSTTTKAVKNKEVVTDTTPPATTKIAIFSTRSLYADGFGKLNVGYNIVPKKYADFWLMQRGVRLATPEEVAEAFA